MNLINLTQHSTKAGAALLGLTGTQAAILPPMDFNSPQGWAQLLVLVAQAVIGVVQVLRNERS